MKDRAAKSVKNLGNGLSGIFAKGKQSKREAPAETAAETGEDLFAKIEKLAKLRDLGAITQEEYDAQKNELLSRI